MIVFLLWISVVSLFIHRLVQNAYCTDKLNSKFSGGEKFATYNQDFSILNIPKETMTWKTGTLKISSLKLDRYLIIHNQGSRYKRRKKLTLFGRLVDLWSNLPMSRPLHWHRLNVKTLFTIIIYLKFGIIVSIYWLQTLPFKV